MSNIMDPINKFYQVYNENNLDLWDEAMADNYVGHINADTIPSTATSKANPTNECIRLSVILVKTRKMRPLI